MLPFIKDDSLHYAKFAHQISSNFGFFNESGPGTGFFYIVGVKDNVVTDLIDTESKLKSFIGTVDNPYEVILIASLNRYYYDCDSIIGGGYKERKDDYLLYLLHCTSGIHKSVRAILTKKGIFRFIDEKVYKMTIDNTDTEWIRNQLLELIPGLIFTYFGYHGFALSVPSPEGHQSECNHILK